MILEDEKIGKIIENKMKMEETTPPRKHGRETMSNMRYTKHEVQVEIESSMVCSSVVPFEYSLGFLCEFCLCID